MVMTLNLYPKNIIFFQKANMAEIMVYASERLNRPSVEADFVMVKI